ncbi:MAG: hypothetical protein K8R41_11735 [Bacteroidales bacterium]|nr:hypothetical protein [Bacteroidales bacterium]
MSNKERKIHTGFRLSKQNLKCVEDMGDSLGLNNTNVVDMILTIIRKDKSLFVKLIQNALMEKL